MELPTEIPTVMQNAGRYFMMHGQDIPEFQRNLIISVMGPGISPVDFVVKTAEALYAVADELDNEGREIAAQAANLAGQSGWHGMFERGNKMVLALRRMNGDTDIQQPLEEDPEILTNYLAPAEPAYIPPPPPLTTPRSTVVAGRIVTTEGEPTS